MSDSDDKQTAGAESQDTQGPWTEIENKIVLTSRLPYELEAVGKAMVDLIKKAPAELQPAAFALAIAVITGIKEAADAAVAALPDYPKSLSVQAVEAQASALENLYKQLPPDSNASVFMPALNLMSKVDETVDPLSSDAPVFPHQLTQSLIDRQAELLIKYVAENAFK
ncbi:MAG TPA: hypothetical protein VF543_08080 [Pyrinomonadaceae bacterium]|jgi:hypothetical protein